MKKLILIVPLFLKGIAAFAADSDAQREALKFFENEVRPLLSQRCYDCHGEKKQKGGLRMDHIAHIKAGGDGGPAVVPGDPEKSLMIEAIRYRNSDLEMPPKEKLPGKEIAVLEKWVKLGAPWPDTDKAVVVKGGFSDEQRKFWCFQPLADPKPPQVPGDWARNDIDRFIAKKHAELKLDPAPEADRRELARRLYFDLHGLPPTKEQSDAFANSTDPQAYEKLIDELLASPRYGERWAQHWLDLVRYAESDGYNQDAYRPAAWPYRDYVIRSLNDDKPYDRFVREQLAGDEIDPKNPGVLVAVSYLRNPIYEYNQRDARGQHEVILTDMTDNAGEVFLGLSMGCARCHDHKFDPILQKDYYRLRAFFAPVRWRDDLKLATDVEKARFAEQQAKWEEATKDIRAQIDAITGPLIEKSVHGAYKKFTDDIRSMVDKKPEERTPQDWQFSYFCERQMAYERERFDPMKSIRKDEDKKRYQALTEDLKKLDGIKPKPLPAAFIATDATAKGPPNILKTRKAEADIAPGFLTLLAPEEPKIAPLENSTGRRTALADWITRPDNQLATRVIVNRVWGYHFGRGLVATPNDLGKLGEPPTHPELLDWLARRFVAGGRSLKKLHREILLSATYRQTAHRAVPAVAARIDPSNRFLWRFNPRRLDAEQARDAILMASGELDLTPGGPSADANGTRRSIYTMKKRNSQNELLRSLDAPAGFASTSERQSTTTPTQALLLVNGDWPLARARKLATRISSIEEAWQYALGRPPTAMEIEQASAFLKKRGGAPEPAPVSAELANASEFKDNTAQERLVARTLEKEGDEVTIEAVVTLDSIDANAAVRTIASRWSGGKDAIEAFGWSLGVTGEKSRFKPRNLIVQLVGEDENANIAYEVIPSDLRLELGVKYHVAAAISCSAHTVTFHVKNLGAPDSPMLTATAPHRVHTGLSGGQSALVIGGLGRRTTPHQWDGRIEAARIVPGLLPDDALSPEPANWQSALVTWDAKAGATADFTWAGTDSAAENAAPRQQALADLCHVLLNANEFFYLH
jgi:hypothetical protein